jgi:hypothetical protein
MSENRRFPRIPMQLTIYYGTNYNEETSHNCIITDVSFEGIGILVSSDTMINHGMKFHMEINIPFKTIYSAVALTWVRQLHESGPCNWAGGGRLYDIGEHDKNLLLEFALNQFNTARNEVAGKGFLFE